MAALDAAPTGSLDILEVSRPPAEAGDTACRQLDQEWQRTRERVAVSTLTRACLLHTPGAPSHATLHPRRIRDAVPPLSPALLYNSCYINNFTTWKVIREIWGAQKVLFF